MPKGKKGGGGMGDMDFVDDEDDGEDPTAMMAQKAKAAGGGKKPMFNTSPTLPNGDWRPSMDLQKKKGGKGWKKRWCHIVSAPSAAGRTRCRLCSRAWSFFVVQEGTKFWYGADKKYLNHGGKGAKWFELTGAELKNYDSMTFTNIPASGPVRDSRIRSAAVAPRFSRRRRDRRTLGRR